MKIREDDEKPGPLWGCGSLLIALSAFVGWLLLREHRR